MKVIQTIEKVYPYLPIFAQNWICSAYGRKEAAVRFGRVFEERLRQLQDSDYWSASEIEAYQNEELQRIVAHAYKHVPYYHDLMRQRKLSPSDIRSREDLAKLPILSKEDVRENHSRLISDSAKRRELVARHTSGTTGKSLHFYITREAIAFQWAVWWRHRTRFDILPGASHFTFTGKLVVPPQQKHPPFWRWNRPMSQALINMQQILPDKIPAIVDFLNEHDFEFYSGYPSIIGSFCALGNELGLRLDRPPKVLFSGAENILADQRREIEKFTGTFIADQYGFSEACGNAAQCKEFVYHEDFEFGIIENIGLRDEESGEETGRIVCTGFANYAFPLIRYDNGDVATWAGKNTNCACGRRSRVIKRIDGRIDDYVVTPEGHRIMRFDYLFKDTSQIKECQIVQNKLGSIVIRVVKRPGYSLKDERFVTEMVSEWISASLGVSFEYVDEIEREPNGKFKAVKSNL